MKSTILLLALSAIVISSCTTAYKSGQTPDDVYYSPVRTQDEYVQTENRRDRDNRYSDDYYEDRYLRMKVQNRYRWSDLDDWYNAERRYRNNMYIGYNNFNNPWNPQTYWNSYYNPYYTHCPSTVNVKTVAYTKPRTFNLNSYTPNNNKTQNSNSKYRNNSYTETRSSNNNSGSILRNIFGGNNNSSTDSKVNTSSSSGNSNSSGSTGSSGSTAPVRKF